jgi:hypothetical protein
MNIQAIGNAPAATSAMEPRKAPTGAPQAQSAVVPADKVTISPAAQKATTGDVDHDGDSH